MALPPGNPDTFIREVDDAVRADLLQNFGARFGKPLIALIVVGLLALAGWLFWQSRSDSAAGDLGASLNASLDNFAQNRPKAAASHCKRDGTEKSLFKRIVAFDKLVSGFKRAHAGRALIDAGTK